MANTLFTLSRRIDRSGVNIANKVPIQISRAIFQIKIRVSGPIHFYIFCRISKILNKRYQPFISIGI